MAILHPALLTSSKPSAVAPASVHITHIQLRDLVLCPREPGVVTYVHKRGIVEHDIHTPGSPPTVIASPDFHPNALAALPIPDTNDILYAAGGQDADLHFSCHTAYTASTASSSTRKRRSRPPSATKLLWQFAKRLDRCSINNSVVLTTSLSLSRSNQSAVEPRVIVSNNDNTVKFFDVPLRTTGSKHSRDLKEVGLFRLNVPINHSSLSPDARTLLSVGDSSEIFLQHISGSSHLTFTPIITLPLPKPEGLPFWLPSNALAASFSTAFSADGAKFAVASQEGVVAVWDVRSTKPMKVFQTDKSTGLGPSSLGGGGLWAGGAAVVGWSNSAASGWLFEDAYMHPHTSPPSSTSAVRAPGWSVRNVKFGGGIGGSGKELMVFTEHANLLHVVDAKTFETEEIIRMPAIKAPALAPIPLPRPSGVTTTSTTMRPSSTRTASESNLTSSHGRSSRSSASPGVDYVYSQLPGFSRRPARYSTPLTLRERDLRDIQERRVLQRAREMIALRRNGSRTPGDDDVNAGDDHDDRDDDDDDDDTTARSPVGYSPPTSIGDSTLRTLRTAGDDGPIGRSRSRTTANMLTTLNRLLRPTEGGGDSNGDWPEGEDPETALSLIPALVEGIEARDVEEILNRHGVLGARHRSRGDGEEDRNTGSAVADFEYPYEFGDSSVWRDSARNRDRGRGSGDEGGGGGGEEDMDIDEADAALTRTPSAAGRAGFNWMTGREEEDVDECDHREEEREEPSSDELDLAGVCFDPTGGRVYVASTRGVAEWNVRGADKRWWSGDGWA